MAESKYKVALDMLKKTKKLFPGNVEIHELLGECAMKLNNIPLARKNFQICMNNFPKCSSNACNKRGMLYMMMENPSLSQPQAITCFTKALEIDKKAEYYYNMAMSHKKLKNYSATIENLNNALEMEANNSEYYYQKGECYLNMSRPKEAAEELTKAIDLQKKPDYYFSRGKAYKASKDDVKSLWDYSMGNYEFNKEKHNERLEKR